MLYAGRGGPHEGDVGVFQGCRGERELLDTAGPAQLLRPGRSLATHGGGDICNHAVGRRRDRGPKYEGARADRCPAPARAQGEIVGDACLEFGRRTLGQDTAMVENGEPIDRPLGLHHVVGDEQDGRALVGERPDLRPQKTSADGIDVVGGLVEHDQLARRRRPPCRTRRAA